MLVLDDNMDFIKDEKLRLKIEEALVSIVTEKKKQISKDMVNPMVEIKDGKISIDLEIKAPGKHNYDDEKITMEEFKSGASKKDIFIDDVITELLDMLPQLTEEVDVEMGN